MKVIDLNKGENIRFVLFPDNQPHVVVDGIDQGDEVTVICSITYSLKMMHLLQASNALDHLGAKKKLLVIPYLISNGQEGCTSITYIIDDHTISIHTFSRFANL